MFLKFIEIAWTCQIQLRRKQGNRCIEKQDYFKQQKYVESDAFVTLKSKVPLSPMALVGSSEASADVSNAYI